MAQKTTVTLIDDLDGGKAAETASFGLDGATYAIDLSEKNVATLRDALAPYVASARRTGGRSVRRAATPAKAAARTPRRSGGSDETSAIREWARSNGYQISGRGRIAANVVEAYKKAH